MKVTGLLLNVEKSPGSVEAVRLETENLTEIYKALGCNIIDIVTRKIGGKMFNIVCDDEGLLRENPRISAIDKDQNRMLVGNLFICNNKGANLSDLTKEEMLFITEHIGICLVKEKGGKESFIYPVLCDVEYDM